MSIITIENEYLRVQINSSGSEMQSFFDKNRKLECLWQGNPDYWARQAPVLFPIVGRLKNDRLIHLGQSYPMSQHGFARDMPFDVCLKESDAVQLRLLSNQVTLKQFPFDFELLIDYRIQSNRLVTTYIIRNPQDVSLPVAIGGHPAFNWPLFPGIAQEAHVIEFEHDENQLIRQLENGLMLDKKIQNPIENKQLVLNNALFENDALIFDKIKSRVLTYSAADEISLTLCFNDFPHFGIWNKPGASFVCLEPWHGYSSGKNFDGDFSQKEGNFLVPGHAEVEKKFEIILD
ncbi:MAG: aldose 1-epimerase family protein [Thiomicrorhabdus sp.]|nr:aldose 1-epimerase family protein [Thiomicrorhabdus sp.]